MASRRFSPADRSPGGTLLAGYRVVVVASSVATVVEAAGGFLCDRARAGWEVSVLLTGQCDARPLAILGVSGRPDPSADPGTLIRDIPRGTTVVIGADLLDSDAHARDAVERAAQSGGGPVWVWGTPAQATAGSGLALDPHELSSAAQAFKAHALRAAGNPCAAGEVEALYRVRGATYRRFCSV